MSQERVEPKIMKRNFATRFLALLMVLCMLAPMTAFAAETYYLEVSIEEQDSPENIVWSKTAGYLSDDEELAPLVIYAINDRYEDGSLADVFESPAMRRIMLAGLRAYEKSLKYGSDDWEEYVDKYYEDVNDLDNQGLKSMTSGLNATIGELIVGKKYSMMFENEVESDPKFGEVYIVTVIRRVYNVAASVDLADPQVTGVASLLNTSDHIAFMTGDGNGNFRPDDSITRAEVAQIFYNLLQNQNVENTVTFNDVPAAAWYAKAVNTMASLGIISGVGNDNFAPNRAITRAEFAAIASRFAKKATSGIEFVDVAADYWAHEAISTAASYGWIAGVGNGMFAPAQQINRASVATMVNKMLGRLPDVDSIDAGAGRQFPDVSAYHWGYYQIAEATTAHNYMYNLDNTVEVWAK